MGWPAWLQCPVMDGYQPSTDMCSFHVHVGVQAAQPTGLQPVEEHSAGPAPPAQRVQPIVQSKQGRGRGRRGQGRQVDSQAEDTDPATDSASQLNAEDQAPKHFSSASEGQPGRSRPPKIPSGPRCVHWNVPCLLPVEQNKHMLGTLLLDPNA